MHICMLLSCCCWVAFVSSVLFAWMSLVIDPLCFLLFVLLVTGVAQLAVQLDKEEEQQQRLHQQLLGGDALIHVIEDAGAVASGSGCLLSVGQVQPAALMQLLLLHRHSIIDHGSNNSKPTTSNHSNLSVSAVLDGCCKLQ